MQEEEKPCLGENSAAAAPQLPLACHLSRPSPVYHVVMTEAPAREKFEQALTDPVYEAAWRYALRLAGSRPDAEDLLQSALARAFVRFGQLRRPEAFRAWLFAIVRNEFLSHKRPAAAVSGGGDAALDYIPAGMPADPAAREVLDALASLPWNHREVLELFYLERLSLKETAAVLGVGVSAVKQRVMRARRALRELVLPRREPGVPAQGGESA